MRYSSHRGGSRRPHYRRGGHRSHSRRNTSSKTINPQRFVKAASPTEQAAYEPAHRFADFQLHPQLHQAVAARNFSAPTPIQDQAIPPALEGRDIVGIANTGTGKTAAFLIPLINKLLDDGNQQALIVTPTRELAMQIEDEFKQFSATMKRYSTLCIGGASIHKQIQGLKRNPHVIIGTPGRIKDLLQRRVLRLNRCHSLVLDEVDRMVDMGFIHDIRTILSQLPEQRQSLFLTATVPQSVEAIMHSFLNDPVTVSVRTGATADNVEQNIVRAGREGKLQKLCDLLGTQELEKTLVFAETKRGVEKLAGQISRQGIKSVSIHGNKTQSQRQKALAQFRDNTVPVMVATDVAARGLDVKDITHVINYDQPQTYDDYIHRIGRAGRAGRAGNALTFV